MYKLCAFDLDGTLVDTIADIAFSVNLILEQMGYPVCEEDSYRRKVGNGMRLLCRRALPEDVQDDEAVLEELVRRYDAYYSAHCCDRSRAYPGIPELIVRLRKAGVRCAVISNKPHAQSQIVLGTLFSEDDFDYVEGQSSRFARKPDPEALIDCMKTLGMSEDETVYVGDSDVDAVFAANAGVACIGVSWGFRGRKELEEAGASFIADTADEIFARVTE